MSKKYDVAVVGATGAVGSNTFMGKSLRAAPHPSSAVLPPGVSDTGVGSVDPAASDEAASIRAAVEGKPGQAGRGGFRAAARVDMMALSHGCIILFR